MYDAESFTSIIFGLNSEEPVEKEGLQHKKHHGEEEPNKSHSMHPPVFDLKVSIPTIQ